MREVIPADIEEGEPAMQVTFEVLRNYSDADQKHLKITTGFGGGDCGFPFEVGEQYLVDADKDDSGRSAAIWYLITALGPLTVKFCSSGKGATPSSLPMELIQRQTAPFALHRFARENISCCLATAHKDPHLFFLSFPVFPNYPKPRR